MCSVPPGWTMTAGSSASPDGKIAGEASQGVTFLDRSRLGRLESLVLVSMFGEVQREDVGKFGSDNYLPATFKGKATVGTYGLDEDRSREIALTWENVRLVPAANCPSLPAE